MPVNIVLSSSSESPSGVGIRQDEDHLEAYSGCCETELKFSWYWTCASCGLRQRGEAHWKPDIKLESRAAVHKWTYDYLEEVHTWVAQWTGLEPKTFELNYDVEVLL